jgi:hypothetical protein
MFRFIENWHKNTDESLDEVISSQQEDLSGPPAKKQKHEHEILVGEERTEVACSLTKKYIRLGKINPSDLVRFVRPSSLIP